MSNTFNELEEEIEYRPISGQAIVAFVFSFLSLLALFNVLLIVIPLLAILLCGVTLWSVGRNPRVLGGNLAWLGMGIACFALSLSLTQFYVGESSRWRTARQLADEWLHMIQQGKQEEVHQLTLAVYERLPEDQDLDQFYAPENRAPRRGTGGDRQPQTEFESYWEVWYPQKLILADGEKGRIEYLGRGALLESDRNREFYLLNYRYYPADENLEYVVAGLNQKKVPCPIDFQIKMARSEMGGELGVHWQVFSVKIEGAQQRHSGVTIDEG